MPPYGDPQGAFYAQARQPSAKSGTRVLGIIALIVLGAALLGLILLFEVTWIGIALSAIVFVLLLLLTLRMTKKGCLPRVLLWVAALAVLFLILIFTMNTDDTTTGPTNISSCADSPLTEPGSAPTDDGNASADAGFNVSIANTIGNTNGNIINNGYATMQDDLDTEYVSIVGDFAVVTALEASQEETYLVRTDGSGLTKLE